MTPVNVYILSIYLLSIQLQSSTIIILKTTLKLSEKESTIMHGKSID